ncbi:MAG: class I SAM-dependent methyltransferase [Gemmataceae bacterium]
MSAEPLSRSEGRSKACIVCGACQWINHFRVLKRCGGCNFIKADLELSPEEVQRLYQDQYFQGEEYGDYLADAVSHRKNFQARLKVVQGLMGSQTGPIFEIGCAYGFWLETCSIAGIEAAGVDVSVEPVRYARMVMGQRAQVGDFLALSLPKRYYSAFCMWDTIEHLANPEVFVEKVFDLLPSGGWFFATTGDIGSLYANWRGPRWRMIHPPTHLQYFSTATMRHFLTRKGFQVVKCQSTPMYRNVGETLDRLARLGKGVSQPVAETLRKITPHFLKQWGFWLDLGDILFVAARKPL